MRFDKMSARKIQIDQSLPIHAMADNNPFAALKKIIPTRSSVPEIQAGDKKALAALRFADPAVRQRAQELAQKQSSAQPQPKVRATSPTPAKSEFKKGPQKASQKELKDQKTPTVQKISKPTDTPSDKGAPVRQRPRKPAKAASSQSAAAKPRVTHKERAPKASAPVAQTDPITRPNPVTVPVELAAGLPVSEHAQEIIETIAAHPVTIICGETGSGKTTQLPKLCLLAGRGQTGMIAHTQPRRIAASSIAKRIAQELHTEVGEVVGYKVRFTDKTMPGAAIKLMTDGILLAETQTDAHLRRYDTIIIDEAHERSMNIDFLLGYLKRLLHKRRDLKVIVTSATIDAERFAQHFAVDGKAAPILTISGRTYPVEVRYRPIEDCDEEDDRTLMDAIADACDELETLGRGDILVFLPGEREIREAAEVLRRSHRPNTVEILPLFARLSAQEQERVFKSGGLRRIVLATNVAETSITVPGIRYVVDTGLARVKRYSYRNKVEQLQIEPVSRASADQRAGRCGRVAQGVCIRLYSEQNYLSRPAFSDPEIMRSNLAGVILRMKSLRLGEVRDFAFVQAPPMRAISDGYAILNELHAVDKNGSLTPEGRALAHLPLDPRLGRMLLEASRRGALTEALIVVSGLAIQDPRDRPIAAQEAADQAHRRFADVRSDFLAYLNMWRWYEAARENKTSNRQLTDALHSAFLSPRRMHEWRDVHKQLSELARDMQWQCNTQPAGYEELHEALLTGLLGNLGMRQLDADLRAAPYLGARGIKFWVWPGSSLAKKGGKWIMAAELVETSRLYARCAADIEPEWVERAAAHLIKKSYSEPHWEKKRAEVMAFERGALYGLTIYAQRRVSFAPHDAALAREMFIREALVAGDYETKAPFFVHNHRLVREIEQIESKTRRPDVLVDQEQMVAFYDQRLDASVVGGASFELWRKKAEQDNPKVLFMAREDLMRHDASGVTMDFFPKTITMAGLDLAASYHFEPGAARDGLTVTVPIYALNQIDAVRCEWLVPGMLKEKVHALIKSLPQRYRRHCVPIERYAEGFFTRCDGKPIEGKTLVDALIDDLREQVRVVCERTDFKQEFLPKHLSMNFKVVDEFGRQLDMGRNLAQLRAQLGAQAQESFQSVAQSDASIAEDLADNITTWSFGELPELMEIRRKGHTLIGHPALVDCQSACALEAFDDPLEAKKAHRAGLRRLFYLQLREQVRYLEKNLSALQRVHIQASVVEGVDAFESFEALRDDVVAAVIEAAAMAEPWPHDAQTFGERKDAARARLALLGGEYVRLLQAIAQELGNIPKKLQTVRAYPEVVKDVQSQLRRLFPKHFMLQVAFEQLRHYVRYLQAVHVRLDRLRNDPERDAQRMADILSLQVPYLRELASRKGAQDARLTEFGWMLEELRVSLFAQQLRTQMPVSVKRLKRVWQSISY